MIGPFHPPVTSPSNLPTHRLFTMRTLPIRYLVIPKCGCTYVKNMIWALEKHRQHVAPLRVHDDDLAFLRASDLGLTPDQIRKESYAFTVLRRPIERFYSLYTDKIIGSGRHNFPPVADILTQRHKLITVPTSIDDHRYNCNSLIEWVGQNIAESLDLPADPHWLPQSTHFSLVHRFNLHLLTTIDLTEQLNVFLKPLVPDIEQKLSVFERNQSKSRVSLEDVLDKTLRRKINDVFRKDQATYRAVSVHWREYLKGQLSSIPRAEDVL
jgi:hypothetical protein